MSKYKVTTDQLVEFDKGEVFDYEQEPPVSKGIVDRNPDWFEKIEEPEVKEGQYWRGGSGLFRIMNKSSYAGKEWHAKQILNEKGCIGFECTTKEVQDQYTLLSNDEAGQALIEEAKRRGFKAGVSIKTIDGYKYDSRSGEYKYNPMRDILYYDHVSICVQGDWAEIIEDEWEVKYLPFVHVTNGKRIISTISPEPFPKDEATKIATALNELD